MKYKLKDVMEKYAKNKAALNNDRAAAWCTVYDECLQLGMDTGLLDGMCGVELVVKFIRDLKAAADKKEGESDG